MYKTMRDSVVTLGLLGVVLGLFFLQSREGFSGIEELTCPDGNKSLLHPADGPVCIVDRVPHLCPTGSELIDGRCQYPDGRKEWADCPQGSKGWNGICGRILPAECGPGKKTVSVVKRPGEPINPSWHTDISCLPSDAETYPTTPPRPDQVDTPEKELAYIERVCKPGDTLVSEKGVGPLCIKGTSGSPTPGSSPTPASSPTPGSSPTTNSAPYPTNTTDPTIGNEIKKVKDSLKPFRPPTVPSSDLEKERKVITIVARRNMYFLQIVLFIVVLVLLSYVILPLQYANPIAFLLLCSGVALGFFLKG